MLRRTSATNVLPLVVVCHNEGYDQFMLEGRLMRGSLGVVVNFEQVAEQPRHAVVSARVNPAAELTRWLFERYRIAYHEQPHAPFLRVVATRRERDGVAVVAPEVV